MKKITKISSIFSMRQRIKLSNRFLYEAIVRRISGMLGNLITYLKSSRFKGSKFKRPPTKSMAVELNEILQQIKHEKENK